MARKGKVSENEQVADAVTKQARETRNRRRQSIHFIVRRRCGSPSLRMSRMYRGSWSRHGPALRSDDPVQIDAMDGLLVVYQKQWCLRSRDLVSRLGLLVISKALRSMNPVIHSLSKACPRLVVGRVNVTQLRKVYSSGMLHPKVSCIVTNGTSEIPVNYEGLPR